MHTAYTAVAKLFSNFFGQLKHLTTPPPITLKKKKCWFLIFVIITRLSVQAL